MHLDPVGFSAAFLLLKKHRKHLQSYLVHYCYLKGFYRTIPFQGTVEDENFLLPRWEFVRNTIPFQDASGPIKLLIAFGSHQNGEKKNASMSCVMASGIQGW